RESVSPVRVSWVIKAWPLVGGPLTSTAPDFGHPNTGSIGCQDRLLGTTDVVQGRAPGRAAAADRPLAAARDNRGSRRAGPRPAARAGAADWQRSGPARTSGSARPARRRRRRRGDPLQAGDAP